MKSSISNGVKQGGCVSPNLFSVYLNKLIEILRNCNMCSILTKGSTCRKSKKLRYLLILIEQVCLKKIAF